MGKSTWVPCGSTTYSNLWHFWNGFGLLWENLQKLAEETCFVKVFVGEFRKLNYSFYLFYRCALIFIK